MKSLGIIRRMDEVGRVVLPKELRETMEINYKDPFEIFAEDDTIILKKYHPTCTFCNNVDDIKTFNGKNICPECIAKIAALNK